MNLLFRVIYAAHAKGTHHRLALDAVAQLGGADAEAWRRMFLKHAEVFMMGSKAPDNVFKDFKNHVLHPRDGYWGGAPAAARQWYGKTVDALCQKQWQEAVNAAGILSHYVTDAVHPFHTGQSEAENSLHRAFEWSTAKSYDALKVVATGTPAHEIAVPDRTDWIEEMLRTGAARSNKYYEKLIAHYDINRGVVDPPAGLDTVAQRIVGDIIGYATQLYAVILERALAEAKVSPPEVSLGLDTVLATLQIPIKLLAKRLADKADRQLVERMYDELKATGTVEVNLPDDDRMVRDLHRVEVLERAPGSPPPAVVHDAILSLQPAHSHSLARVAGMAADALPGHATGEAPAVAKDGESARARMAMRSRLSPEDDIVDAPSIGPRMAERLRPIGLSTVADLLAAEAETLARVLGLKHVSVDTIADWQAQTRLACAVPGLTGTGAQLLVGGSHRAIEDIVAAEPEKLCADVLAFAASAQGRRLLRDGEPPRPERIKQWAVSARRAMAA